MCSMNLKVYVFASQADGAMSPNTLATCLNLIAWAKETIQKR